MASPAAAFAVVQVEHLPEHLRGLGKRLPGVREVLGVVEPSAVHPAVPRAPIDVGGQVEQKEPLECVGPTS